MNDQDKSPSDGAGTRLAEVFAGMNLSELPAMSAHVHELISLTHSSHSAAYELSKVVLKDYSLTNKVLQVVNSAYYALEKPVTSISRAVTILGFDAVRDLAMAIAIFEDFIKSGVEKEGISKILARSFLSAIEAREIVARKKLPFSPEESFICALLHNLGRIIVCVYLPDRYQQVEKLTGAGAGAEEAEARILDGLKFEDIGQEIARFWNLGDSVIAAMVHQPRMPRNRNDQVGCMANIAAMSNQMTDCVCDGGDLRQVVKRYRKLAGLSIDEAVEIISSSVEASEDISDAMRFGLSRLRIKSRLARVRKEVGGKGEKTAAPSSAGAVSADDGRAGLPTDGGKSVNDFIREITEILTSDFQINDFYVNLLEGLYRGIGFDRIILAVVRLEDKQHVLVGRFGLGDAEPATIHAIRHSLAADDPVAAGLRQCQDQVFPAAEKKGLPGVFRALTRGRTAYLLPVCLFGKAIALIYMDRLGKRPLLTPGEMKSARLFRDLAVMALQKMAVGPGRGD